MNLTYCDICGHPINGETFLFSMVSLSKLEEYKKEINIQDSFYFMGKVSTEQKKLKIPFIERKEVCLTCKKIIDTIFEGRRKEALKISKSLNRSISKANENNK